jgi:hypothetical protein
MNDIFKRRIELVTALSNEVMLVKSGRPNVAALTDAVNGLCTYMDEFETHALAVAFPYASELAAVKLENENLKMQLAALRERLPEEERDAATSAAVAAAAKHGLVRPSSPCSSSSSISISASSAGEGGGDDDDDDDDDDNLDEEAGDAAMAGGENEAGDECEEEQGTDWLAAF